MQASSPALRRIVRRRQRWWVPSRVGPGAAGQPRWWVCESVPRVEGGKWKRVKACGGAEKAEAATRRGSARASG
eukprot:251003-Lingulodinium_polyedra.AAC.1